MNVVGKRTLAFACRHRTQAVVTCFLGLGEFFGGSCWPLGVPEENAVVLELALDGARGEVGERFEGSSGCGRDEELALPLMLIG